MNIEKSSHDATDILRDMHSFAQEDSDEIKLMSLKKVNDELVAANIKIERPADKVFSIFEKVKAKESLAMAAVQRAEWIRKFKERNGLSQATVEETKKVLSEWANKIFQKKEAFAYCRKFENANKEDLETLIMDLMLLDEMKEAEDVEGKRKN